MWLAGVDQVMRLGWAMWLTWVWVARPG
jgi:hypothetical protein